MLPKNISSKDKVILFDGVCKLCNAWSKFIIRYDTKRTFKLCSVQSDEGKALLRHFGYPENFYETMLVVEGDQCFEKSDAFFQVMDKMSWPWKALVIFRLLPKPLRDWMYDRIALNRYKIFGKYDHCLLPSPDHDGRFLNSKN